jgi:UDPglucose 6-dehydrogenase
MQVTVVGSGYVGLVASACLAELGQQVICVDSDRAKIEALQRGETPIHERFLPELLARHCGTRLTFTSFLADAVQSSSVIFVAVGTPSTESGDCDLSAVESVARELSRSVNEYKLVVQKSTVPVCTSEWVRRIMILNGAPENSFEIASNPEFLREGTAVTDFLFPDRIVVGVNSERAACLLREIYRPLTDGSYVRRKDAIPEPDQARIPTQLIETSARSAELIKHASNAFLAMKISFINAVANICEAVDADIEQVCAGVGSDARIGDRFLSPGIGYGGSCFPKDLKAFRAVARESGYDFRLLDEVIRINEEQCRRFLRKVRNALWTLKGKRLAVLGLAFKGGTDDVRESPAIAMIELLLREGCEVAAYDPAAVPNCRELLDERVTFAESAYEAAENADALLLLSDWEEFAALDLQRVRRALKYPIVIDGRNLYDREMMAERGFMYYSVGRPDAFPRKSPKHVSQLKKAG